MSEKTIYLASFYHDFPRMQEVEKQLAEYGIINTARWIKGEHEMSEGQFDDAEFNRRMCMEDYEDLCRAKMMLFFNEVPSKGRGGRWVELGIALFNLRIPVVVIGQRSNVFCFAPGTYCTRRWDETRTPKAIKVWFDDMDVCAATGTILTKNPNVLLSRS